MEKLHDGQCGLCAHFGEEHPNDSSLLKIRTSREAPGEFTDECGHPQHAPLHLKVSPTSGCAGFEPVKDFPLS